MHVRSRQAAHRVEPPLRRDVRDLARRRSPRHAARGGPGQRLAGRQRADRRRQAFVADRWRRVADGAGRRLRRRDGGRTRHLGQPSAAGRRRMGGDPRGHHRAAPQPGAHPASRQTRCPDRPSQPRCCSRSIWRTSTRASRGRDRRRAVHRPGRLQGASTTRSGTPLGDAVLKDAGRAPARDHARYRHGRPARRRRVRHRRRPARAAARTPLPLPAGSSRRWPSRSTWRATTS